MRVTLAGSKRGVEQGGSIVEDDSLIAVFGGRLLEAAADTPIFVDVRQIVSSYQLQSSFSAAGSISDPADGAD